MQENRISATLSDADQQAVLAAINTIRQKLPFLIDLTPEERRALPKMGDKSRAFVSQALDIATQNEDILPRSFDVEEMRKDVELLAALAPIMVAFAQLQEWNERAWKYLNEYVQQIVEPLVEQKQKQIDDAKRQTEAINDKFWNG